MPERTIESSEYRYGFNGKEKDAETQGEGNQYDYGFRIYNPRIGRFLSVDPLMKQYPWYSSYQFAGNMPIAAIDVDGLENYVVIYWRDQNNNITKIQVRAIFDNNGQIKNQGVHKIDETEHIAKGNVLVFEIKRDQNNRETISVIVNRNKPDSKLTKQEENIFNNRFKIEDEKDESEALVYQTETPQKKYYESVPFDNSKTETKKAEQTFGIIPRPRVRLQIQGRPVNVNLNAPVNISVSFQGKLDQPNDFNQAEDIARQIASQLRQNPNLKITITGYVLLGKTPDHDDLNDNVVGGCNCTFQELAKKRAEYIKDRILKDVNGPKIDPKRVKTSVPKEGHTEQKVTVTFISN